MVTEMMNLMEFNTALYGQRIFKYVMDAFAHPLQVYDLSDVAAEDGIMDSRYINPLTRGEDTVVKDLCCVLLDHAATFAVFGDGGLATEISELTFARQAALEDAGHVIIKQSGAFHQWSKINRGTLADPHKGATVIIETPRIEGQTKITAAGPGINGHALYFVDEGIASCLRQVAALDIEYPQGFELLFVTPKGLICAAPRRIKVQGEGF